MAWLTISGIDLSSIIGQNQKPKAPRRDIGDVTDANDGSKRATRSTRKFDFSGVSIPLSAGDAFSWESLITGAGNVFSFDTSYYSSKGVAGTPNDGAGTSIQGTTKKFGAGALKMNTAADIFATAAQLAIGTGPWTQAVWWKQNTAAWHRIVLRSDGARFIDGVRNDSTPHPFNVGVSGDIATLTAAVGPDYFDDWVIMSGLWLAGWPALDFANNLPFSPLPYLTCTGDLVPEGTSRKMIGQVSVDTIQTANPGGGKVKTAQQLQVDLLGA